MALRKACDDCGRLVDEKNARTSTQIHVSQSVSEQRFHPDGSYEYRYLTQRGEKLAFCNDECEMRWRDARRSVVPWLRVAPKPYPAPISPPKPFD